MRVARAIESPLLRVSRARRAPPAGAEAAARAKSLAETSSPSALGVLGGGKRFAVSFARSSTRDVGGAGGAKRSRDDDDSGEARPPPAHRSPQGCGGGGHGEPTNALFVAGLPADCSHREAAHIFRPFPGFLGLRVKEGARGGPLAFVDFDSSNAALVCLRAVDGYRVDGRPEVEATAPRLRVDFAKAPGPPRPAF